MGTILQVYQDGGGRWGGRILRDGMEDGRVGACTSVEDVEYQAAEAGIGYERVEHLDHVPPVDVHE